MMQPQRNRTVRGTNAKMREHALRSYLVQSAKIGDRGAMGRLVTLVSPRLLAHAARLLGEPEQARDAVQAAWVEILRGLPKLRDDAAFLPWALRITSRRVARLIGQRQRERALARDFAHETPVVTLPEGPAASDARNVRAALNRLSPDHRATVALFYLEDLSLAEVARALDVPIGTVKTRLMHARTKLRAFLEGDEDDR